MSVRQIMPGALRYSLMSNMVDQSSSLNKPFLLSALFLSGFAALIYEIIWQRILVRFLGGNFSSVSLIVCVFLGGMAIGAMLVSIAQSKNKIKTPATSWASLELLLWAFGIVSIYLSLQSKISFPDQAVATAISIFLLLIPTIAMGAILPIAINLLNQSVGTKAVLASYTLNTAGALAGVICTSFLLLPKCGIWMTLLLASSINFSIGAVLHFKRKRLNTEYQSKAEFELQTSHPFLPAIAFISGWTIMMLEVSWTRYFSLLAGTNTYIFGLVVAFCLAGLSIGSWIIYFVTARKQVEKIDPLPALAVVFTLAGLCLMTNIFALSIFPHYFHSLFTQCISTFRDVDYFQVKILFLVIFMNLLILVPCTVYGTVFPLVLTFSDRTAKLLAFNTAGCVAGYISLWILFENYTHDPGNTATETCFLVILAVVYASALILIHLISRARITLISGICLTIIVLSAPFILLRQPWPKAALTDSPKDSLRFFKEGQNAVVSVENTNGLFVLKTNGKTEGSLPDPVPSDMPPLMSDMPTQVLLGLLPQALNGTKRSSGLVIGMGTGMTCGTAIGLSDVENCTVVEIEKTVIEAAREFAAHNHKPWESPKCKVKIADARQFLNSTNEKFDWIVSQPGEPSNSGSANLYTNEFFELARKNLKEGGIIVQWIPLNGLKSQDLQSLLNAFTIGNGSATECYVIQPRKAGELILVSGINSNTLNRLQNIFSTPDFSSKLYTVGINSPSAILADFAGKTIRPKIIEIGAKLNTDDNLQVELSTARNSPSSEKQIIELEKDFSNIFNTNIFSNQTEQQLKYSRIAHSIPGFTCESDYYLLSKVEPETISEIYPKELDASLFGLADSPASITYKAFTDLQKGSNPEDCLTLLEKSLQINPLQYIANYYAAYCHLKSGNTQDALWKMKTASQIYPISNRPHFFVCAVLIRDGQIDLAKQNITRLSKRNLKTPKEKQWLDGLNRTISTGNEDPCIEEILKP